MLELSCVLHVKSTAVDQVPLFVVPRHGQTDLNMDCFVFFAAVLIEGGSVLEPCCCFTCMHHHSLNVCHPPLFCHSVSLPSSHILLSSSTYFLGGGGGCRSATWSSVWKEHKAKLAHILCFPDHSWGLHHISSPLCSSPLILHLVWFVPWQQLSQHVSFLNCSPTHKKHTVAPVLEFHNHVCPWKTSSFQFSLLWENIVVFSKSFCKTAFYRLWFYLIASELCIGAKTVQHECSAQVNGQIMPGSAGTEKFTRSLMKCSSSHQCRLVVHSLLPLLSHSSASVFTSESDRASLLSSSYWFHTRAADTLLLLVSGFSLGNCFSHFLLHI